MADWTAPFKLPTFTDDAYEAQKEAYTKARGYTITMPAWDDVIILKPFPPMTEKEIKLWTGKIPAAEIPDVPRTGEEIAALLKAGKHKVSATRRPNAEEIKEYRKNMKLQIPLERRQEIEKEKNRKKDRVVAMLASPSPRIARNAGSIMVALDNAQDALSTLACIGMIAGVVGGAATAAALAGPVGIIGGAAALLNLINPMSRLKGLAGKASTGRKAKKDVEKFSDRNPFSKKGRAKIAKNISKFKPGMSHVIEALQVTQNIFGVGISLGPITGFIQDVIFGTARAIGGAKVTVKTPPPPLAPYAAKAAKALKSLAILQSYKWKSDMSEEGQGMVAANLALQAMTPWIQLWNPFEQVEDLANCEIEAPRPEDPLTIEIFEELGLMDADIFNWPQNGQRWISLGDLQEATAQQATDNLVHFAEENAHSPEAFLAVQSAHDFALGTIEAIEGPGSVAIEYSQIERIIMIILDNGWAYPDDITDAQREKFEEWCYVHEYMNTHPTSKDISRYAQVFCGFSWVRSPDELR